LSGLSDSLRQLATACANALTMAMEPCVEALSQRRRAARSRRPANLWGMGLRFREPRLRPSDEISDRALRSGQGACELHGSRRFLAWNDYLSLQWQSRLLRRPAGLSSHCGGCGKRVSCRRRSPVL